MLQGIMLNLYTPVLSPPVASEQILAEKLSESFFSSVPV